MGTLDNFCPRIERQPDITFYVNSSNVKQDVKEMDKHHLVNAFKAAIRGLEWTSDEGKKILAVVIYTLDEEIIRRLSK